MAAIDEAAAAFGLVVEQKPEQELGLWPENENAVRLFGALQTQWRTGPGGAIGLDYGPLPTVASILRIRGRALREAFNGLQVMEGEALRWIAEQRR